MEAAWLSLWFVMTSRWRLLALVVLLAILAISVGRCEPPDIPIPNPLPRR